MGRAVDIVIDDDLRTVIANQDRGQDDATWERRVEVWRDPRAVVGAIRRRRTPRHDRQLQLQHHADRTAVREPSLLPLEEAVHYLTGRPGRAVRTARTRRHRRGARADVEVFDPATVGPGPVSMQFDLPGGAGRVYGEAVGVHHVVVNGVPCVEHGELLDARPGGLLRSGRDTSTVTAH